MVPRARPVPACRVPLDCAAQRAALPVSIPLLAVGTDLIPERKDLFEFWQKVDGQRVCD